MRTLQLLAEVFCSHPLELPVFQAHCTFHTSLKLVKMQQRKRVVQLSVIILMLANWVTLSLMQTLFYMYDMGCCELHIAEFHLSKTNLTLSNFSFHVVLTIHSSSSSSQGKILENWIYVSISTWIQPAEQKASSSSSSSKASLELAANLHASHKI